jgi:hypothetical protein
LVAGQLNLNSHGAIIVAAALIVHAPTILFLLVESYYLKTYKN